MLKLYIGAVDAVCCAVFVVCFMEHTDHVTGAVTQQLQKAAWEWFHVTADKVYVWQYNGRTLDSEHFVYLLNDIGKALVWVLFDSFHSETFLWILTLWFP